MPITDAGMANLDLKNVVNLNLDGLPITDAGLKSLPDLPSLRNLQLTGTKIEGPGLSRIAAFRNLEQLLLNGSAVTDDGLRQLAGAKSLVLLFLDGIPLSAAGLKPVVALPRLQYLSIRGCQVPYERRRANPDRFSVATNRKIGGWRRAGSPGPWPTGTGSTRGPVAPRGPEKIIQRSREHFSPRTAHGKQTAFRASRSPHGVGGQFAIVQSRFIESSRNSRSKASSIEANSPASQGYRGAGQLAYVHLTESRTASRTWSSNMGVFSGRIWFDNSCASCLQVRSRSITMNLTIGIIRPRGRT